MADRAALRLRIANNQEGVCTALDQVQAYLHGKGYNVGVAGTVMVVADEIISNVARNAFPETGSRQFSLTLAPELIGGDRYLRMVVEDDGIAFDPTAAPTPDTALLLEERDIGSLGIHLVRSLSRSVSYVREAGTNRLDVLLGVD